MKKSVSFIISLTQARIVERLVNCSNGWRQWSISTSSSRKYNGVKCLFYINSYMRPTWITNLATLHYNALLIHPLTFLKTDVNLFFLIGAAMKWDPRSSTSDCEVFARRDVSWKYVLLIEFANRSMHRCCHFFRPWSSSAWRVRSHI